MLPERVNAGFEWIARGAARAFTPVFVALIIAAALAPSAAFAWVTQVPWGTAPSGGGGAAAYWPWGLGRVTNDSAGGTWGSHPTDAYQMFPVSGTTYIATSTALGGPQQFLAWQTRIRRAALWGTCG